MDAEFKILQIALGEQRDLQEALLTVGDVIYWDWSGRDKYFNFDIIKLVNDYQPNVIFLQLQAPGILNESTAQHISKNAMVFNWTGDVRYPTPKWYYEIGRHIHMTLFTNMYDVQEMWKNGYSAGYLQIGFPEKIFTPDGPERHEADIVFMGNNFSGFPLSDLRGDMVRQLTKRYGKRFKAFGSGWPGYTSENSQAEQAKIYRGAKIGINISHFNYARYSSDRIFRIMAAGCLCLSHRFADIEEEYDIGINLDVWNDINSLFGTIDYYLDNDIERQKIATAGCMHVHANHTWKSRMDDFKRLLT